MRPLAVALLSVVLIGCAHDGVEGAGYRVQLPAGWKDYTREYAAEAEKGLNASAPAWAQLRIDGLWMKRDEGSVIAAATLRSPPRVGLDALARRMIGLSDGGVADFRLDREPSRTRLVGEPATNYDWSGVTSNRPVRVRVVLIRHEGRTHLVSLTTSPRLFQQTGSTLAEILASWEWS